MDASIHDWLQGHGEPIVLVTMIDDATGRLRARFYPAGTVEAHMDLLGRWLRQHGRPLAPYTDRHSIFEPHEKGQPVPGPDAKTQFGRALEELDVGGRSGRTPAEPYPPDNGAGDSPKRPNRPAQNHPWRKSFKQLM